MHMSRVHLVFKRSTENMVESVVKMIGGAMIHCDMVPQKDDLEEVSGSYTCYMGESFSRNKTVYNPKDFVALTLMISDDELQAVESFLGDLVDRKVPYNLHDMLLCPFPSLYKDIPSMTPAPKVFCSQAVVLCLRECLQENKELLEMLQKLNSRCVTPNMLWKKMLPFCHENTEFHQEIIYPLEISE